MADEQRPPRRTGTHHGDNCFWVWAVGWLFTIGYLGLPFFWKGLLALLIWPYYLGVALAVR